MNTVCNLLAKLTGVVSYLMDYEFAQLWRLYADVAYGIEVGFIVRSMFVCCDWLRAS